MRLPAVAMYLLTGLHSVWIWPATWLLLTQHNWWGMKCLFISVAVHSKVFTNPIPNWWLSVYSCIWEIASCSAALPMTHSQSLTGRGNVISIIVWVQNGVPPLLPWFKVTSLSTQRQELGYEWIYFVIVCLYQIRSELWVYSCIIGWTLEIHKHSCLIGTLSSQGM